MFFDSSRTLLMLALVFAMTGCMVGADYVRPAGEGPSRWHAPTPHGGSIDAMGAWWSQFDDVTVSQLIARAERDSPTLTQAWAAIERARASLRSTQAGMRPQANAGVAVSRSDLDVPTSGGPTIDRTGGLDASWEIDLFGKIRRSTQAAQARIEARTDDWHDARISLAAEVADTYVQFRSCELQVALYERELASIRATGTAIAGLVRAGFSAPGDGALSSAGIASTASTLVNQRAQCDLLVKSLVALTGEDEVALRRRLGQGARRVPRLTALSVDTVPADVIRQRPDVVALEREVAASSALVGAAQADLYPSLSLNGSISVAASTLSSSTRAWSFGPSLSIPLFDDGRRRAAVDEAVANQTAALAAYRQGVRQAIKEVEQTLVTLDRTRRQSEHAEVATDGYQRYLRATDARWRAGLDSLITLEQARRDALTAELQELTVQRERVRAWIALYKALGGGWTEHAVARSPASLAFSSSPAAKE